MSNAINNTKSSLSSMGELLANRQPQIDKSLTKAERGYAHEFQVFGDRLTQELDDEQRRGLYMKLAKHEPRSLLEQALFFVRDANANKKAALFMWKLGQLKQSKSRKSPFRMAQKGKENSGGKPTAQQKKYSSERSSRLSMDHME
jgi:hypothetical protein